MPDMLPGDEEDDLGTFVPDEDEVEYDFDEDEDEDEDEDY